MRVLVLAYVGGCAFLYFDQRNLLYFAADTHIPAAETNFSFRNEGVTLRGWLLNPGKPRALIYFGGNAEGYALERDAIAATYPNRTVYLVSYRGYGASEGSPSERALFSDALALFDAARAKHASVAVVGRSLGSGVASYLASRRPVERLALVTPFDGLEHVAHAHYPMFPTRWMLEDRYESTGYIGDYRGPILVLRAGRDEVVPPSSTDLLIAVMPYKPIVKAFPAADHNSIADDDGYAQALSDFMK